MNRPQGECVIRTDYEADRLYIEQADPRILISIIGPDGQWAPDILPLHHDASLTGGVLTIRAINRTVVYRLIEYVPHWYAWLAEWPD